MNDDWILPDWVGKGATFKLDFGPNNRNTKKYHVLAIVDEDMVVLKWWSKRKKRWFYIVECPLFINSRRDGVLIIIDRKKMQNASIGDRTDG